MNYDKSEIILEEVKKSQRIVLNCHRGPDPDGIGCVLAMKNVLEKMGKSVEVICPSKVISKQTNYLTGYDSIKTGVDFATFDFSEFDLLIALDTPNLQLMTGKDLSKQPAIKTIVVDHHYLSTVQGAIELRDKTATSVGEMLYLIFSDWGVEMDKETAEDILTSIMGDTGALAYPNVTAKTLRIAADLIEMGVNKDMIVNQIYRNEDFQMIKFWSDVLARMEIDREHHFVYSMIPFVAYGKYSKLDDAKAKSASLFAPIIAETDFGLVGVEEKPGFMTVSFRGRTGFDTSQIAKELGGGGHKVASAAKLEGLDFDSAVKKILEVARKYARK